jgi:metal-sulfur cluster biosynthetic enzyme
MLRVRQALRAVLDPEIGINVVDLGLVYRLDADAGGVTVHLTTTLPGSPLAPLLTDQARAAIRTEIGDGPAVEVRLVWEPPWQPEMMTPAAKRQLDWVHLAGA